MANVAGSRFTFVNLYQLALLLVHVSGHSRWKCPEPRSPLTSIKTGPCGDDTNNFETDGAQAPMEVQPGPLRVAFEESVHHRGSPFRISLSGDGSDDFEDACVLLDHIPHNDNVSPRPIFRDPSTYTPYYITIDIPNVSCERCSLHLSNPMTDKIGEDGSPTGPGCTDPEGSCFSVYYSCTKTIRILGTVPRSQYQCQSPIPSDWPTEWVGDDGSIVDASVPGVYRRESSIWNVDDYTLETVPSRYRLDAGGICGAGDSVEIMPSSTPSSMPSKKPSSMPSRTPPGILVPPSMPSSMPSRTLPEILVPPSMPSSMPSKMPPGILVPSSMPSKMPSGKFAPSSMPSKMSSGVLVPSSMPSSMPSIKSFLTPENTSASTLAPTVVRTTSMANNTHDFSNNSTTPTLAPVVAESREGDNAEKSISTERSPQTSASATSAASTMEFHVLSFLLLAVTTFVVPMVIS